MVVVNADESVETLHLGSEHKTEIHLYRKKDHFDLLHDGNVSEPLVIEIDDDNNNGPDEIIDVTSSDSDEKANG